MLALVVIIENAARLQILLRVENLPNLSLAYFLKKLRIDAINAPRMIMFINF